MRLLIYQNYWTPYRNALFSELAKCVDLTVVYLGNVGIDREWSLGDLNFRYEVLRPRRIGPFLMNRRDELRKLAADIVVFPEHLENLTSVMRISRMYAGKMILWTGMYNGMNPERRRYDAVLSVLKRIYRRILYPRIDHFFAYSSMTVTMLKLSGIKDDQITIIPQAVEAAPVSRERFQQLAELRWQSEAPLKLLSMGYLRPEKNNLQLIRLVAQYSDEELQLTIGGSGPEEAMLKAQAGTNVCFAGYLTGDAKLKALEEADVFILPTIRDPWGLVVNEAMAVGLPVLCSSYAGAKDAVDRNGYIFDPGDNQALKEILSRFIDDRSILRGMGERSIEIIRNYSLSRAVDVMLTGFDAVLSGGNK